MKAINRFRPFKVFGFICIAMIAAGCVDGQPIGGPGGPDTGGLSAETTLTSTSLTGGEPSAAQISPNEEEVPGLQLTPDNVTGEVLSLLFTTDGQAEEGLVIFGNGRPDIAPADSDLIEFDFAEPQPIFSTVQLKPGFVGGQSSHLAMLFGYMDLHFELDGDDKVVRLALAEVNGMQRGDKLLLEPATGDFQWYDLDAETFTTTRPDNPALVETINTFTDPIRPDLVFYPVNAVVLEPIQLDPVELADSNLMTVTIDFVMLQAITLVGELDQSTVTDEELIISFDLTQNATDPDPNTLGFGESGFFVDAEMNLITVEIAPVP